MDTLDQILERARRRAVEKHLPYIGALHPLEAYAVMQGDSSARLVDVRTRAEVEWVGHIAGALAVEWNTWPGGRSNPEFFNQLKSAVPNLNDPVMFLCRSGGRSHNAAEAATKAGYHNCYNVLEGFEGDKDQQGRRNTVGGWRKAGLPWTQT